MCFLVHKWHKHRKLQINEEDPVIDLTKGTSNEWRYYQCCLATANDKFLVTDGFKEVVRKLNSKEKIISICGPKGVGKSLALAAIAELSRKNWPCLLWSPRLRSFKQFLSYVRAVYAQYGK